MKIFVTGSTGMIGKRIVRFLEKNHEVVECARSKGVNILDYATLEKTMKGCQVVIHAAGEIDETKGENELRRVNVEGTKNVLEAAEKNKVKRFIHVSTVGVYVESKQKIDENAALRTLTTYERTKKEAEDLVRAYQATFNTTLVRSALVMGPNPYWGQIFKIIRKGFPLIGKGENAWQMVHVDDLAGFIVHVLPHPKAKNEIYVVAEKKNHTLREVVDMIADIQHVKHVKTIPKGVGILASYAFALQGKILGKKPLLIPAHVKRLFKNREYDIRKALSTGWKPKYDTYAALEKTYAELKENGIAS